MVFKQTQKEISEYTETYTKISGYWNHTAFVYFQVGLKIKHHITVVVMSRWLNSSIVYINFLYKLSNCLYKTKVHINGMIY